jgi:outer membrane protein assembly factor BamD (BamD/ComL family)
MFSADGLLKLLPRGRGMGQKGISEIVLSEILGRFSVYIADEQASMGRHICLFLFIMITTISQSACSHFNESNQARPVFEEANQLFNQGNYKESLDRYQEIFEKYPLIGDRALFEMGVVNAYPRNDRKDYQKALECFQKLIKEYPASDYRQNSETMIFSINNFPLKDRTIASQQAEIEALRQQVKERENEVDGLQKQVEALEKKLFSLVTQKRSIDKILIEKKARKLSLISKGEVLKSYKIALGGDPNGPKERQGDNKTPEGSYCIIARNRESGYHRSLQISYPNERDKKRARQLGVSPGGNIMIHGIKKGYSWVGDAQADVDWTKGCIAVTDDEIEEIDRLVPIGTPIEIMP